MKSNHPSYAHSTEYKARARPPTSDTEENDDPWKGCRISSERYPGKYYII